MEFENECTVDFTMIAFSQDISIRKTTIYLSNGEIEIDMRNNSISTFKFSTNHRSTNVPLVAGPKSRGVNEKTRLVGHCKADYYLMDAFVRAVSDNDPTLIIADINDALKSHLLVFAAEESRKQGVVVNL